jgi:hypothetical protein
VGFVFDLGIGYLDLKDWPDATTALRTAGLLGPDRSEATLLSRLPMKGITHSAKAMQEIMVSLRLAPSDPEEGNMKAVICTELGDLVCVGDCSPVSTCWTEVRD